MALDTCYYKTNHEDHAIYIAWHINFNTKLNHILYWVQKVDSSYTAHLTCVTSM